MGKKILSVILGVICAILAISLVEIIGHQVVPPPLGLNMSDPNEVQNYLKSAPTLVFVFLLAAWATGGFVGGFVATYFSPERGNYQNAIVCGGILTLLTLINLVTLPHPTWLYVALLMVVPKALLGAFLANKYIEIRKR